MTYAYSAAYICRHHHVGVFYAAAVQLNDDDQRPSEGEFSWLRIYVLYVYIIDVVFVRVAAFRVARLDGRLHRVYTRLYIHTVSYMYCAHVRKVCILIHAV